MSYLVLARKYRPATFAEVVGQDGVVRTIKNAIDMERVAHAYLFTGARGVGKTTVARLLAKALNCEKGPTPEPDIDCAVCQEISRGASPDVFEIDGASNTGVDDVRALRDNLQYMPARSRFKIYIIDEVHMLSTSAFNALLKTLEEPPAHVKFIFATTEPHKIPLTVLSRCQRFDFKRIPSDTIQAHLQSVLAKEGMQIADEGLRLIARQAGGSMRDGLSLTDQVLAFGGEQIDVEQVRQALGLTGTEVYEQVADALLSGDADALMRLVESLFDEGHDLKRFIEGLLWHVHHLILFASLKDPADLVDLLPEERDRLAAQAGRADVLRWHQVFDVLSRTAGELARNPYPRLVVETALLRLAVLEPVVAVDELVARVEQLAAQIGAGAGGGPGGGAGQGRPIDRRPPQGRPPQSRAQSPQSPGPRRSAPPRAEPRPQDEPPPPDDPGPASQPEPPPPAQAPGANLTGVEAWEKLVEHINTQRPSLGSFLTHARPLTVEPGRLVVGFEPGSFFADQVKAKRNRRDLDKFAAGFFGRATQVEIAELTEQAASADQAPPPSLAEAREQAARQTEDELKKQALEHPMVQEAIRVFGAEVETVKTRPEQEK